MYFPSYVSTLTPDMCWLCIIHIQKMMGKWIVPQREKRAFLSSGRVLLCVTAVKITPSCWLYDTWISAGLPSKNHSVILSFKERTHTPLWEGSHFSTPLILRFFFCFIKPVKRWVKGFGLRMTLLLLQVVNSA